MGPDGIETGPDGRIFVAQYGGGRVLVLNSNGTLKESISIPYKFVNNVTYDARVGALYVTAVRDVSGVADPTGQVYPGAVLGIAYSSVK